MAMHVRPCEGEEEPEVLITSEGRVRPLGGVLEFCTQACGHLSQQPGPTATDGGVG